MSGDKAKVFGDGGLTPDDYTYSKNFRTALPQFLAVSAKNLVLLGYGMTLGFSTILMPAVLDPKDGEVLHLNKSEISWISSINLIIVPLGCALSGVVTSPIGRRRAMQMVNVPFCIAWLMFHFATSTGHLYGALFITGLAGGLLEAPVSADIRSRDHTATPPRRTDSHQFTVHHPRVFTQFLFGIFMYWRTVALVNITFTVMAILALCFVPESPHWLVSKKRFDDARKSLQWLRGWTTPTAVESELRDIQVLFQREKKDLIEVEETMSEKMSYYTRKSFMLPFFLVTFTFFVGNFSGMTTLQTYAVSIFQMLRAPIDKYYATLILGVLQIVGAGTCVLLVHYTGKRPLTLFSTSGAGICCILVAIYDVYIKTNGFTEALQSTNATLTPINNSSSEMLEETRNPHSWIPMTLLMLLALLAHTGLRLLPWILIGEVFSAKTRSGGAGVSSAIGYLFGFLSNKLYISMVDTLSIWGTYGFYGIVCFVGVTVFYFILPETEGKKLNDIENHYAGRSKLNNQVYRSQKKASKDVSKMHEMKGAANPTFEDDTSKL
ncbi:hypothetical protein HW555_005342 [Spodoptera exigua]|uniref:Major facilitator superfamily (MFS) profile domain-containing protein n=1 Tax=Spodoptera exigua TaxID=7107 RepID=A0A835GHB8_SPOEX|nr:hypothetical protein HW555_005342 [Spodoptera exigua]